MTTPTQQDRSEYLSRWADRLEAAACLLMLAGLTSLIASDALQLVGTLLMLHALLPLIASSLLRNLDTTEETTDDHH